MAKQQTSNKMAAVVTGFILSLILTMTAYFVVTRQLIDGRGRVLLLAGLAVMQLYVQLIFFLHIAEEKSPRWNVRIFAFMLMVVGIVVGGSLWIMDNLNYHMISPEETDTYIIEDEGINP